MTRERRPVWLGEDKRTWDHVRVHVQILDDDRLGVYEVGAYMALAKHAEVGSGSARPSKRTIAGYLRCSERKVQDAIKVLEGAGYVEVVEQPGHASIYRLLPPPTPAPGAGVPEQDVPGGEQEVPTTQAPGAPEQEPGTRTMNERTPEVVRDAADDTIGRLCDQLADRVAEHMTAPRPAVTKRWRTDMRLLIERGPLGIDKPEPIPPERVERCIAFVFEHLATPTGRTRFCWANQVRSPHALREHWAQLLRAAKDTQHRERTTREDRIVAAGLAPRFAELLAEQLGEPPAPALNPGEPANA